MPPRTHPPVRALQRQPDPGATTAAFDAGAAWSAVLARDATQDGRFVYAVTSTRIYCRPSCPSRRPARERVQLFSAPGACDRAEAAGFRACKRCRPHDGDAAHPPPGDIVGRARALLDAAHANGGHRITLGTLASAIGTSSSRLHRAFTSTVGVTPREYQEHRRMDHLRERLRTGSTVSAATYDAGFSGSRRVYESAVSALGMTPGTFRRGGAGVDVHYAIAATSLGRLLVATTARGICAIALGDDDDALRDSLDAELPNATITRSNASDVPALAVAARLVEGQARDGSSEDVPALDVGGTAFQQRVWRELQRIPAGETRTYSELAAAIGQPTAVRAVARACATNRLALVIPCHRVIRGDGSLGGYRWGVERKKALLERERRGADSEQ